MNKLLVLILVLTMSSIVKCQDEQDGGAFAGIINSLIEQWGQVTPEQWSAILQSFTQGGLHHIFNSLGDHCSSNVECGPDACCMKPSFQGKRALIDGSNIHFGSYCASLRQIGDTCSHYDQNLHYYNFHCPCVKGAYCQPGALVQIGPLSIPTNSVCKANGN